MAATLALVRHLPTPWNLEGRLQGRRDIAIAPPTEEALAQIAETRPALDRLAPFQAVYCSTLQRTHQTAAAYGFPDAKVEPLLDELDFGPFEGKLRTELLQAHGDAWLNAPQSLVLGEPLAALAERVRAFLERVRPAHGSVLVFGHGAWIRAARAIHETGSIQTMNQRDVGHHGVLEIILD